MVFGPFLDREIWPYFGWSEFKNTWDFFWFCLGQGSISNKFKYSLESWVAPLDVDFLKFDPIFSGFVFLGGNREAVSCLFCTMGNVYTLANQNSKIPGNFFGFAWARVSFPIMFSIFCRMSHFFPSTILILEPLPPLLSAPKCAVGLQ